MSAGTLSNSSTAFSAGTNRSRTKRRTVPMRISKVSASTATAIVFPTQSVVLERRLALAEEGFDPLVAAAPVGLRQDVAAGGECARAPRDHDRADRVLGVEFEERRVESVHQRLIEGIKDLWPVEHDDADAALALDDEDRIFQRTHS